MDKETNSCCAFVAADVIYIMAALQFLVTFTLSMYFTKPDYVPIAFV